jgi:hypothetical protein
MRDLTAMRSSEGEPEAATECAVSHKVRACTCLQLYLSVLTCYEGPGWERIACIDDSDTALPGVMTIEDIQNKALAVLPAQ